jgi:dipeptidyl aminopeptidase/acylaminoacyl peptidase
VVEAAFAERGRAAVSHRPSLPRLALALALAAVVAALLLSPAGATVRHWIGEVFEPGARNAEPALTRIPGGGRLAVSSPVGPWVVEPDGARRLLGDYREATWSPHGLYLAAVSGRTLTAVEPDGDPHWSIAAPGAIAEPRWSPSGLRIAYRSGGELRVVHADGTADILLEPRVAPVAPSWAPGGAHRLAYVDGRGRVVVRDADRGRLLGRGGGLAGLDTVEWGPGGVLLEASATVARVRHVVLDRLSGDLELTQSGPLPLPASGRLTDVALSPDGRTVAVLRQSQGERRQRAEVDLVGLRSGAVRRLFGTPGRLGEIAWSPDHSRLLIAWPQADQWLFVPVQGRGKVHAVADIASQFDPGARSSGAFPRVDGWCCPASPR